MKQLLKHIHKRMAEREMVFCVVGEDDLARAFPPDATDEEKRREAIREFARKNGFSVNISGARAVFTKI